jgi:uncharacterized protein YjbJ (UPF0337 family)
MSGTTLVLEGGDALHRPAFEVRLGGFSARAGARGTTSQEDREMSFEEQAKGKVEEGKGRAEQAQGDLTGDNAKKGDGMLDEAKGKLRQGADKARDAVHDATAKH